MPKKTTYSRSGGQAQRKKQKSFELVGSASDENVLEIAGKSEKVSLANLKASEVDEAEDEEYEEDDVEEVVEVKAKKSEPGKKVEPAKKAVPVAAAAVATSANPKSAAARMAARRQAAQKNQRSTASLIVAENYGYVRKDLVFILILAVIMFAGIIVMHFVPAIGG